MPYLIQADFKKSIQTGVLNSVIGSDTSIINSWLLTAEEKATSYLSQKYITSQEFTDTPQWVSTKTYNAYDRVFLDAPLYDATKNYAIGNYCTYQPVANGIIYVYIATIASNAIAFNVSNWQLIAPQFTIYYAQYPFPYFNINNLYNKGDKVFWLGKTYTALQNSIVYDDFYKLQHGIPLPPVNYIPTDTTLPQWSAGVSYSVPVNTLITNTTYWTLGDNRSQQIVKILIDIVLYFSHGRISPMNIPEHIKNNYNEAINWLKDAADGMITPNLPHIQPNAGARIRYGIVKSLHQNNY
jgi:Protein of unknown function (DUF1320)